MATILGVRKGNTSEYTLIGLITGKKIPGQMHLFPEIEHTFPKKEPSFPENEHTFHEMQPSFQENEHTFPEIEPSFPEIEHTFPKKEQSFLENEQTFSEIEPSFSEIEPNFPEIAPSFQENVPMMSNSSGKACMSPRNSRSSLNESVSSIYNWMPIQPRKEPNENSQFGLKFSHLPVVRKSHYLGGNNFFGAHEVAQTQLYTYIPHEIAMDSVLELSEKIASPGVGTNEKVKLDEAYLEPSCISNDVPSSTKVHPEAGDQQDPRLNMPHSDPDDFEPQSVKPDVGFMPKLYNYDLMSRINSVVPNGIRNSVVPNGIRNAKSKNFYRFPKPWREFPAFEISTVGLKLRSSIQSNFLANELRLWDPLQPEEIHRGPSETIRRIGDILLKYGIVDNVPIRNNQETNVNTMEELTYCDAANSNSSQNNETSSSSETIVTEKKNDSSSANCSEAVRLSTTSMQSSFSKESKLTTLSGTAGKEMTELTKSELTSNVSHNNETAKRDQADSDVLRKYGSSVDYVSAGRHSLHSKSNYGRYDYGKGQPLSGDTSSGAPSTHTSAGSVLYDNNKAATLKKQTEGSQVDVAGVSDVTTPGVAGYSPYGNVTSAADSVEYSLSNERQRLRRLNNLITGTSISTPKISMFKPSTSSMVSPHQSELHQYKSAVNTIAKVYSSPTFTSTSPAPNLIGKTSWAGSLHHTPSMRVQRSDFMPGKWAQKMQPANKYGSSMNYNTPYRLQSARHNTTQHNNSSHNSMLVDLLHNPPNTNKNHQKAPPKQKQEFQLKNTKKSNQSANKQSNDNKSGSSTDYTSSLFVHTNSRSDAGCATKSGFPKPVSGKTSAKTSPRYSRSPSCRITSYQFAKDLDRMFPKPLSARELDASLKYTQHTPFMCLRVTKVETFHNIAKQLFENKKPQTTTTRINFNSRAGSPERQAVSTHTPGLSHSSLRRGRSPLDKRRASKDWNKRSACSLERKNPDRASLLL